MGAASAAITADFLTVRFRVALGGASALAVGASLVDFFVVRLAVFFADLPVGGATSGVGST
jgi:hypothetical protein